jgi:hypothetical protein
MDPVFSSFRTFTPCCVMRRAESTSSAVLLEEPGRFLVDRILGKGGVDVAEVAV